MARPFRFAVVSDPHIALPHTIWDNPKRFHLVEVSIPALQQIFQSLETQSLDFLLLPGDLTQHGERENHEWLVNRLRQLPFPVHTVPGNHDVICRDGCDRTLSMAEFPQLYSDFGFQHSVPYYHQVLLPGIHLIGLNSIAFDAEGQQFFGGYVDEEQLAWLSERLKQLSGEWAMVMIHHNVLEHLPGQTHHPLGQRYIVKNRQALIDVLKTGNISLILTGHLHVQDIAQEGDLWEITTGSLVSYPHPYRIVTVTPEVSGHMQLQIESFRVESVPDWPHLQATSLQWMRDRSIPFMVKLLSSPPFELPLEKAQFYAPELKDFWANIADGDANFNYDHFPSEINQRLRAFGALDIQGNYRPIDNQSTLRLSAAGAMNV
ncbi:metallophosphoesterase [Oscillatoria sp. CS-180]|uniref:metallophosphoesterase family protein n=1 Tax=Oscillatoria sp. CS-180 TaxID=3021720 RepID=UPI00233003C8|nr:metallophosphoesterase [Oscillatoria sp. CS-180]MDB9528043.1 metallophosphoesterase [Oscillatoria sp. CS-180]